MVPRVSGLGRFHCTHNAYSTLEEVKEEVTTMLATLGYKSTVELIIQHLHDCNIPFQFHCYS